MADTTIPTVTASLNKATYIKGETITLTVNYRDADTKTVTVTITVKDAAGNLGTATVPLTVADPLTLTVTDTDGRVWAKVSDSGSVAVYSAVA